MHCCLRSYHPTAYVICQDCNCTWVVSILVWTLSTLWKPSFLRTMASRILEGKKTLLRILNNGGICTWGSPERRSKSSQTLFSLHTLVLGNVLHSTRLIFNSIIIAFPPDIALLFYLFSLIGHLNGKPLSCDNKNKFEHNSCYCAEELHRNRDGICSRNREWMQT